MKKRYMTPAFDIIELETEGLLYETSIGKGGRGAQTAKGMGFNDFDDFDDEDDGGSDNGFGFTGFGDVFEDSNSGWGV